MDDKELLLEKIKTYLISRNETIAVAESVTTGLLQNIFGNIQEASLFFEGGITVYNIKQKIKHLHVNQQKAESCNSVSAQTAEEMAIGVSQLFNASWSIAITGYATPVKESDFQLFAYFAITHKGNVQVSRRIDISRQLAEQAQEEYVNIIIEAFGELIH